MDKGLCGLVGILEFLRFFNSRILKVFFNLEFLGILDFARNSRILAYSIRTKGIK